MNAPEILKRFTSLALLISLCAPFLFVNNTTAATLPLEQWRVRRWKRSPRSCVN